MKILALFAGALLLGGCAGGSAPAQEVPQVCVTALNNADKVFNLTSDIMDVQIEAIDAASIAFQAVADFDVYTIQEQSSRINGLTSQVSSLNGRLAPQVSEYITFRDACLAAANRTND